MQKIFLKISSLNLVTYDWSLNLSFKEHLISSSLRACQFCISIVIEYLVAFEIKFSYFVINIIVFTQF